MRFFCDEMFARLARLLRAAGHDTALAVPGARDEDLLAQTRREARLLLTRDRRLAAAAGQTGLLLRGERLEDLARELSESLRLDWTLAPFTRCLVDNTPLAPATAAQARAMPPSVQALPGPFNACPACGRLYWPGSHVKRLAARLDGLSAIGAALGEGNEWLDCEVEVASMTEFPMSKHDPSGHTPTTLPADDLKDNPGIGESKGTTISGEDPSLDEGENTTEGDVANDTSLGGGIDPDQRGRTNP